jgi:hypothetical protein
MLFSAPLFKDDRPNRVKISQSV